MSMKCHEHILNGFQVIQGPQNTIVEFQREL